MRDDRDDTRPPSDGWLAARALGLDDDPARAAALERAVRAAGGLARIARLGPAAVAGPTAAGEPRARCGGPVAS